MCGISLLTMGFNWIERGMNYAVIDSGEHGACCIRCDRAQVKLRRSGVGTAFEIVETMHCEHPYGASENGKHFRCFVLWMGIIKLLCKRIILASPTCTPSVHSLRCILFGFAFTILDSPWN